MKTTFFTVMFAMVSICELSYADDRDFHQYDVSILLHAEPKPFKGSPPDFEYDYDQIPHLPAFNQIYGENDNKKKNGLINDATKQEIITVFEKLPGNEPLSFPFTAVIVGMRVAPCNQKIEGKNCISEMRLIAEDPHLGDRSVHLVHKLSQSELKSLLIDLKTLNDSCGLSRSESSRLNVHPCSKDNKFISGINSIMQNYSNETNFQKVTFQIRTSDNPIGAFWIFAAAEKINGTWDLIKTKSAPNGEEFFAFGSPGLFTRDMPLDKTDELVKSAMSGSLTPEETERLIQFLEDPSKTTVEGSSCMSCHAPQRLRRQFQPIEELSDYFNISDLEKKDSPDNAGVADIRHFGYMFGVPKISQRVINETEVSLSILNE